MIVVKFHRNIDGFIYGFDADQHGDKIVCSAVSALTINLVNSIKAFTNVKIKCDYSKNGGHLVCLIEDIKNGVFNNDVNLLFNSLLLGLNSIMNEYKEHLLVIDNDKEVI